MPHVKYILFGFICIQLCISVTSYAQVDTTLNDLENEIIIVGYSIQKSPASVDTLQPLLNQPSYSLVSGLNTLPGVRMEERSPGSYRLSIRGSLLRSPFGVRNVKIYLDDFPLTDAGGNTYLNALDASSISSMEVWRGPYGSLYGANTGGVVRIRSYEQQDTSNVKVSVNGGSYGFFHQNIRIQQKYKKHFFTLNQAYQHSDGYREQSAMKRQFYQASYQVDYHKAMLLKVLAFYSDLNYETPGGLTFDQYKTNPTSARPRAGMVPGAVEQDAQVRNKMLFAGLSHEAKFGKNLKHVTSIFGTHTNFQNPAISNFEKRNEITYGTRTYLEASGAKSYRFTWNWNVGLEWQKTQSKISNYRNDAGRQDTLQAKTDLNARQYFLFSQFSSTLFGRLIVEAGLSLNNYKYDYRSVNLGEDWTALQFNPQVLPRLALSYKIREQLLWRASVSKGYSAPTIAEIRPNDALVHAGLQPEDGWNYETGLRFQNKRLQADLAVFYYALKQAIVSRTNISGAQYFVNAGGTKQPGLETKLSYQLMQKRMSGFIRSVKLKSSTTVYAFTFDKYVNGLNDYSGNRLTGVPRTTVVSSMYIEFLKGFYVYVQYNHTSAIPLNDGNIVYATAYNLLQTKVGWNVQMREKIVELYFGIDNILNEKYSLGNDLNAFGGRYYNAAPLRNFYFGATYRF